MAPTERGHREKPPGPLATFWGSLTVKQQGRIKAGLVGVILLAIAVVAGWLMLAMPGCTAGQMTPPDIKDGVYQAQADGAVTLEEIAAGKADPSAAMAVLRRIVGTPQAKTAAGEPHPYDDGLLAPVRHWFRGTKPAVTSRPAGG